MTTTETQDSGPTSFYVESPKGNVYQVTAQGRSDLVARGYRDITEDGGAEKFAQAHGTGEQKAPEPQRPVPQARPRQGVEPTPGPAAQNPEDAAKS